MQRRTPKRNPAPAPQPQPEPSPAKDQPAAQDNLAARFIENIMSNLAMNENRAGQVARRVLRMKRDGTKLTDAEDAQVKALLRAIGDGYERASKAHALKPDGQGNELFSYDLPPELQDKPELQHAAPAGPPAPDEMPEWVNETPPNPYHLIVEGRDEWEQEIDLTHDEYVELKRHLAVMRGHIPQELDKAKLPPEVVCVDKSEWDLMVRAYEDLGKVVDGLPLDKKAA
jgi:hypothetical protein